MLLTRASPACAPDRCTNCILFSRSSRSLLQTKCLQRFPLCNVGWETPCSMRAMSRLPCPRSRPPCPRSQLPCTRSHLPCPSFYLPEYTSHSDWLHHNNLIYIVILNYIYCPVNNKICLANKGMHPLMEWVHAAYTAHRKLVGRRLSLRVGERSAGITSGRPAAGVKTRKLCARHVITHKKQVKNSCQFGWWNTLSLPGCAFTETNGTSRRAHHVTCSFLSPPYVRAVPRAIREIFSDWLK